ncbi:unnamed protein product [Clavelina lepadiformis]|uniref:Uncharacterized protein n=1 Tax=Clavelina lepadiformis TaxID=159417 RepID=A0ABP0GIK4_CLALP
MTKFSANSVYGFITVLLYHNQTMEYHQDNMQVDFLLKAISDMVSQQFKSIRQDMKIEFAKVQENMEDMVSKILAETKKAETINNATPIKQMSQALDVESDTGICIKEVRSENASVVLRHLIERHFIERHFIERHLIETTADRKTLYRTTVNRADS